MEKGERKKVRKWEEERIGKVGKKERKRLKESLGYLVLHPISNNSLRS